MSDENKTGFHPLVDLIIARMESHPEELEREPNTNAYKTHKAEQMARIIMICEKHFTTEEHAAIKAAEARACKDLAHKALMAVLLEEDKPSEEYERLAVGKALKTMKYHLTPTAQEQEFYNQQMIGLQNASIYTTGSTQTLGGTRGIEAAPSSFLGKLNPFNK